MITQGQERTSQREGQESASNSSNALVKAKGSQVEREVAGLRNHASSHKFYSAMTEAFDSLGADLCMW